MERRPGCREDEGSDYARSMSDDDWESSSEGDLDPELTEEAGDADWEPARGRVWSIVLRVGGVLLIAALVVPVVLRALQS